MGRLRIFHFWCYSLITAIALFWMLVLGYILWNTTPQIVASATQQQPKVHSIYKWEWKPWIEAGVNSQGKYVAYIHKAPNTVITCEEVSRWLGEENEIILIAPDGDTLQYDLHQEKGEGK